MEIYEFFDTKTGVRDIYTLTVNGLMKYLNAKYGNIKIDDDNIIYDELGEEVGWYDIAYCNTDEEIEKIIELMKKE